jgi:hypothetical protein
MKVALSTYGGHLPNWPSRIVDTEALPASAAKSLVTLVAAAKAAPPVKAPDADRIRDPMSYSITIDDGMQPVVLEQSDTNMTDAFRELRNWIRKNSTKSAR